MLFVNDLAAMLTRAGFAENAVCIPILVKDSKQSATLSLIWSVSNADDVAGDECRDQAKAEPGDLAARSVEETGSGA